MSGGGPDAPMGGWPDVDRERVVVLARVTYLEFCRGASRPGLDGTDPQLSALHRACSDLDVPAWSWEADRVMAGLFNRFYLRSIEGYVPPHRFVERADAADRRYAGLELCALAHARALHVH